MRFPKTNVRPAAVTANHNGTLVRAKAPGLKVKTNIKAGATPINLPRRR